MPIVYRLTCFQLLGLWPPAAAGGRAGRAAGQAAGQVVGLGRRVPFARSFGATMAGASSEGRDLLDDEEYVDEEAYAAQEAKMQEALELNAQLKAMMAEAEAQQRQQHQQQQQRTSQQMMHGGGAPPPARQLGVAKNGGWGGLTHTAGRAQDIARANQILVTKLSNIATDRRSKPQGNPLSQQPFQQRPFRLQNNSSTINRRRKDDQIARENAAMAKRLNSVKATSNLSSKHTQQHAQKHTQLLRTLGPGGRPSYAPPRARSSVAPSGGRPGSSPTVPMLTRGLLPSGSRPPFEL
jgi:hypothetical protein